MESMTGFATVRSGDWVWTLRSVNAKGLDVRLRLASDCIENDVREAVRQTFGRGTINVVLESDNPAGALMINTDFLKILCREALHQAEQFPAIEPGSVAALMNVRGVVEAGQTQVDPAVLKQGLAEAVAELKKSRLAEGEKMKICLTEIVDRIEALVKTAKEIAGRQTDKIREVLENQYRSLKDSVPLTEERFLQEVTTLVLRSDVREELDRLAAHIETARELFAQDGSVGRKLDFLCQEFNREANTLCSKSADIELTRTGMELKSAVDQLREQIQNIE